MKVLKIHGVGQQKRRTESITDRQERIDGWRQDRIAQGRVLLLGAGALGNEAAKNLALMGLGYMFVADMDHVSRSNLSRAVFFRESDARQRRYKAEIVAKRARAINVSSQAFVQAFHGDIVWQLGSGVFRRVDVVLGCLDNIEARMKANANCLFTNTPFLDGGILGLAGSVTAVHAPTTACWECTTSAKERTHASSRYDSCSRVMRRDIESGRLPTVQVASSIIAGFQTQEAVKVIQGQPWAAGCIIQYDANAQRPDLDALTISRRPGCWCNGAKAIDSVIELPLSASDNTLHDLLSLLVQDGYADSSINLAGPFVVARSCLDCHRQEPIMSPLYRLDTLALACRFCGAQGNEWIKLLLVSTTDPREFKEIEDGDNLLERMQEMTLSHIGFPALALISFFATGCSDSIGVVELSADAAIVMGGEQYATVLDR